MQKRKPNPAFIEAKYAHHFVVDTVPRQERGESALVWPPLPPSEQVLLFNQPLKWTFIPVSILRDLDGREELNYYVADTGGGRKKMNKLAEQLQTLVQQVTGEVTMTELLVGEGYVAYLGNREIPEEKIFELIRMAGGFEDFAVWERRILNPRGLRCRMGLLLLKTLQEGNVEKALYNVTSIARVIQEEQDVMALVRELEDSLELLKDHQASLQVRSSVFQQLEHYRRHVTNLVLRTTNGVNHETASSNHPY